MKIVSIYLFMIWKFRTFDMKFVMHLKYVWNV